MLNYIYSILGVGNIGRLSNSFKETFKSGIRDNQYFNSSYDTGHLMPSADAIFPVWQKETYYLNNAKPQKPAFNRGAWRVLELGVRKEAIALMQTFEVYTGAFDLIGHLNKDLQLIEVHKFWYKIVKEKNRLMRRIVFIGCNDEQINCITELASICRNICEETRWLSNTVKDKIICCSLDDFYKSGKVTKIPETEGFNNVLISFQWGVPAAGA